MQDHSISGPTRECQHRARSLDNGVVILVPVNRAALSHITVPEYDVRRSLGRKIQNISYAKEPSQIAQMNNLGDAGAIYVPWIETRLNQLSIAVVVTTKIGRASCRERV